MKIILETDKDVLFSEAYATQLHDILDDDQALEQCSTIQTAPLPDMPGQSVPYVRLDGMQLAPAEADAEPSEVQRPILFVPGFTGGILAKLPFAAHVVRHGRSIIVPGENRLDIMRNEVGRKDATRTQAENMLAVLAAEGLAETPGAVDVVTHSYGALIFDEMSRLAARRDLPCFEGAHVAMLDPVGFIRHEWIGRLAVAFIRNVLRENGVQKDFEDTYGEMLQAGVGYAFTNKWRTFREIREMRRRRVAYHELLRSGIGSLAVLSYGQSPQFSADAQRSMMRKIFEDIEGEPGGPADFAWMIPFSCDVVEVDGVSTLRGRRDATHNDDQFNPKRVVGATLQAFAAASAAKMQSTRKA